MTGYKLDNLKVLTENNSIGKVVTAGFWESDAITELLEAEPQKLIMFEPDNTLYAAATANYADDSSVEIRNATLADKTGEADYFVFKPNRFSSLLKPKQLVKIYRKNTNDSVISINLCTVQNVCEEDKLTLSAGNILLLGLNCPSSIISGAEQKQCLSFFDVIIVRQPRPGLYETEDQQDTLSTVLLENKFNVVQELSHDPMYTQFVYVRDHQSDKINTLHAKVTEAEFRSAEISKKLEEEVTRSSQIESSMAELTARNSQLDTALAQVKAQKDKLSAEAIQRQTEKEQFATQVASLQKKLNEQAERQNNVDAKIAELTQQRDQQAEQQQETKEWAEALKVENDKLSTTSARRQTVNAELSAQVTSWQAKHNELTESQKDRDAQIAELTLQRDQQTQAHQAAKQQAETLKTQNDNLSVERTRQQIENEELAAQVASLQAKLDTQAESQKDRDAQIAELMLQRDQQTQAHQAAKQQAETLKTQNDNLSVERTRQQIENEELAAQVASLQAKLDAQAESQKDRDAQIAELVLQRDHQTQAHQAAKQQAENLNQQCEELKVYNIARQKSADLALKLQSKAQIDLDNLREQYQTKHRNEQQLVDLVSELRVKLQQAAEYYYELQATHPELSEVTQEQGKRSQVEDCEALDVDSPQKKRRAANRSKRRKAAKSATSGKL